MAETNNTIVGDFLLRNTNDAQQLGLASNAADLANQFANALFDVGNQDIYNHFLDYLIKVPGSIYTRAMSFENVLKPFIKSMKFGSTAIENQVGWVQAHTFDQEASKLLKTYKTPGAQAYHNIDYAVTFPVTINFDALRTAFFDETGLNQLIATCTQAAINSDEYQMYKTMMQALAKYDEQAPIYTTHYDSMPDSEGAAKKLLSDMLAWTKRITFPNSAWNASAHTEYGPIATFGRAEDLVLMVTPEIYGYYQVLGYGMLFNSDRATVPYRVVVVDEFPIPGVFAVLCDQSWFQTYDQIYTMQSFFDGSTLSTQYFLHHTAAISASPFAPIACFGTRDATVTPIVVQTTTGLTITPNNGHITRGGTLQLTANLTGTLATDPEGGDTGKVDVKPDAAVWSLSAEVPATTGANATPAKPVQLNARTRVDRDMVLHLQATGIPDGTIIHVTGTSAYTNPSGDTTKYTKTIDVTVDD